HAALRALTEQPGRGIDRRSPGDLLGFPPTAPVRARLVVLQRLDPVEVDVREAVPLLLVELDPGTAALHGECLPRDGLAKRRVLVAVFVLEHEACVPGLRLERVDLGDVNFLLHPEGNTRRGKCDTPEAVNY